MTPLLWAPMPNWPAESNNEHGGPNPLKSICLIRQSHLSGLIPRAGGAAGLAAIILDGYLNLVIVVMTVIVNMNYKNHFRASTDYLL